MHPFKMELLHMDRYNILAGTIHCWKMRLKDYIFNRQQFVKIC
jgi:hypothetical protein